MSGFAGFFDLDGTIKEDQYSWIALVRRMAQRLSHRGSGSGHTYISPGCALAGVGTETDARTHSLTFGRDSYHIVLDGELTNRGALQAELNAFGILLQTGTDAELILNAYIRFGPQCAEKLEGGFSFVIDDCTHRTLFLCRDRFGIKPLFYTFAGGRLVFSSEIKGLFEYPGVRPVLDRTGLCELFGFGGVRTPGCGVFEGISEIMPAQYAVYNQTGFHRQVYWQLQAKPFIETSEAVDKVVRTLIDSFSETSGLPEKPIAFTISDSMLRLLTETAIARDLPAYGSSHLDLYARLRDEAKCAPDVLYKIKISDLFAMSDPYDLPSVVSILRTDVAAQLDLTAYVRDKRENELQLCPVLRGESAENRRFRQQKFTFLHIQLPYILECIDRYAMYCGLPVDASFADHKQIEYIFNLPYGLFNKSNLTARLPIDTALPRTNTDLALTTTVIEKFTAILLDTSQPINRLIDREKAKALLDCEPEKNASLILWLLQLDLWMNHYKIRIHL